MPSIAELLMPGAIAVQDYAKKLLKDIEPANFAQKPSKNGALVEINHPAFIVGHLSLYPSRILKLLGQDFEQVAVPQRFHELFAIGSVCQNDPGYKIYPAMDVLVSAFLSGTDFVLRKIPEISDSTFHLPNPEERTSTRFPSVGAFVIYLLHAHPNGHLGQISAWRRFMGMGPA